GDAALDARTDCTTIAEDTQAVAAFSFTGIGQPLASCLAVEHDVIFLTTYDLSKSEFDEADGRLFSVNHGPADILTYAVRHLAAQLQGKRIGVVYDDTSPDPEVVQTGLLDALTAAGIEPVRVDVLPCAGEYQCSAGIIPSVQGMLADGVDVIFPLLNTLTLPNYMAELATQGVQPGQIQFYNTSFLAQDSEFVSGKMVEFAGDTAGKIYDGAIIISASRAGEHRLPDFTVDPFVQMCNDTYVANSTKVTTPYDFLDDDGNRQASSVASHCSGLRLLARAIEAAGVNPTRAHIAKALASLGAIDSGEGSPSSFVPGKPTAPDVIVQESFHYPCPMPTTNSVGNCILPDTDYLPIPQG
ncbi:MAG: ABC transporter substrate-binding protein, partial [Ilumatobacteraceae bacterium]